MNGTLLDGGTPRHYRAIGFDRKLPEGTLMHVTVATPNSVVSVPFTLKDVALP